MQKSLIDYYNFIKYHLRLTMFQNLRFVVYQVIFAMKKYIIIIISLKTPLIVT